MANIKSQIKRIGTNKKAQERNKAVKSQLKTAVRATREAITAGDATLAEAALVVATKRLDKATSKGVIHANQAANRKSALAKAVAGLPAGSAKAAPGKAAPAKTAPAKTEKPAAKAPAKAAAAK
jgi:small subunit ribosomal protein S20